MKCENGGNCKLSVFLLRGIHGVALKSDCSCAKIEKRKSLREMFKHCLLSHLCTPEVDLIVRFQVSESCRNCLTDVAQLRRCTIKCSKHFIWSMLISFKLILTFNYAYSQTNSQWFKRVETNRRTMNLELSGSLGLNCSLCPGSNPALVLWSVGNSAAMTWITSQSVVCY